MRESYISRLPLETLCEIFSLCLNYRRPWFLGKICASWRDIIWSAPHLWSSVSIRFSYQKFKSQIELLDEWVARSGSSPLSICIDTDDAALWRSCPPAEVMRIIEPHAIRWRHVELTLPLSSLYRLTPKKDQFLLLTSIVIRPLNPPDATLLQDPIDVFCSAPQLHDVDLRFPSSPSCILFPWQHLTRFSGELNVKDCMDIIQQTPKIINCTLNVKYTRGATQFSTPRSRLLSHLETLVMSGKDLGVAVHILRAVMAPALLELRIIQTSLSSSPYNEVLAFLARSACSLKKLHWRTMVIDGPQLIRCLQSISSLVELNIVILHSDNTSMPSSYPIREQVTLSKLKSLVIEYSGDTVELGHILNSITLPAIESIAVEGHHDQFEIFVPTKPILGFLARSSQSLRRLSIQNIVVSATQLFQHLKSVPSLVELTIRKIREDTLEADLREDDVISLLDLSHTDAILPNLEVFEYRDAPFYFDGEVLKSVLTSRWRGEHHWVGEDGREQNVAQLSSITIMTQRQDDNQPMYLSGSVIAELLMLTDEGMNLSLTRYYGTSYI